jgi:hypothetical protein
MAMSPRAQDGHERFLRDCASAAARELPEGNADAIVVLVRMLAAVTFAHAKEQSLPPSQAFGTVCVALIESFSEWQVADMAKLEAGQ